MTKPEYQYIDFGAHGAIPLITIRQTDLRDGPICYGTRDEILSSLDQGETESVLLDLTHVKFIGSIGFLVFVGLRREFPQRRFVLCGLSQPVRDAFIICRLISDNPNMVAPFEVAVDVDSGAALIEQQTD